MTWRTCVEDAVAHGLKAVNALLQFRGVQIHFSRGGHRLFPFLGVLELQQQFLRRAVIGRGFERRQDVFLGLVLLAGGEIGLRQIELRGGLVERVHRDHSVVFADRAGIIVLREPQIAEMAVQSSSFTG